ncbi:tRNA (guanine(26)-n(2))-dimethyltransferase [Anaeramoeba flamelloides]|uniref:tRNA (guanine(26)-N(2))-dimethyltransferase n=1 Tax=Anaeramoeba flamelloides TaxID=1746091 RepID=A0AAV7ZQW5_9EUKA|nr:tRNA (guanine(26)-n(2))-dimethyltransferase [Anaeramoeba flamelloides]
MEIEKEKITKEKEKKEEKNENKETIQEGLAIISNPNDNTVFYNPVQIINRDMSTLVIQMYAQLLNQEMQELAKKKNKNYDYELKLKENLKPAEFEVTKEKVNRIKRRSTDGYQGLKILEALSATGLRSIRYFKEIDGIANILANDLSETAFNSIHKNVKMNKLNPESEVIPSHGDAIDVMMKHRAPELQFDVIDLDPYGSASIFLDPAIQSIQNGGLLCVTCTDMTVLCGKNPTTVYNKYGALPMKRYYCHEFALRLVLGTIERTANKHKKYIVPLLSLSMNFYIRMFVRVFDGPGEARKGPSKLSHAYQSTITDEFVMMPLVNTYAKNKKNNNPDFHRPNTLPVNDLFDPNLKQNWRSAGPIWNQPIHDQSFVEKSIHFLTQNKQELSFSTFKRMMGILSMVQSELPDSPLYYSLSIISSHFKSSSISLLNFRSALANAGFKQSGTHCLKNAIKTDAPISFIYRVYCAWIEKKGEKESALKKLQNNKAFLHFFKKYTESGSELDKIKIDFTPSSEVKKQMKIKAFYPNPQKNWGPKKRASGKPSKKQNQTQNQKKKKINEK